MIIDLINWIDNQTGEEFDTATNSNTYLSNTTKAMML